MSQHRINLQPALVLHQRPYRDSSLIVEMFTAEHGRIGAVARGARRPRSARRALLQPFIGLLASWSGRHDLHTLTAVERGSALPVLSGDALLCGFYINEIVYRLLPRHDPHPELFDTYRQALALLTQHSHHDRTLRLFEHQLLNQLGYGLSLEREAHSLVPLEADTRYCYLPDEGPVALSTGQEDGVLIHGASLIALAKGDLSDARSLREIKRLMRTVLARHLGSRPLRSRELFRSRTPAAGVPNEQGLYNS